MYNTFRDPMESVSQTDSQASEEANQRLAQQLNVTSIPGTAWISDIIIPKRTLTSHGQ